MPELVPGKMTNDKQPPGCGQIFLGIVVIAVVLVALVWACTSAVGGRSDANDPDALEWEAVNGCENLVEQQLRSPATASFDSTASLTGSSTWTVRGAVDAENAFGATVRTDYACSVTIDGDRVRTVITELESR